MYKTAFKQYHKTNRVILSRSPVPPPRPPPFLFLLLFLVLTHRTQESYVLPMGLAAPRSCRLSHLRTHKGIGEAWSEGIRQQLCWSAEFPRTRRRSYISRRDGIESPFGRRCDALLFCGPLSFLLM